MTERTLHLVTVVDREHADGVETTAASVEKLRAALGELHWRVRWVAIIGGHGGGCVSGLRGADHVINASSTASAVNLLSTQVDTGWVARLDVGDEADADGWVDLVWNTHFGRHAWVGTNATHHEVGVVGGSDIEAHWPQHSVTLPATAGDPTNIVARTALVHAVGGWDAVGDPDYAHKLSAAADGYTIPVSTVRRATRR